MIGPPSGAAASRSRLVTIMVFILVLLLVPVMLLVVAALLLRGGPALVEPLVLLLRVEAVIGREGVVQVVVVALVGAGVGLLLAGVQLQRAVPHAVTGVDQQTCRKEERKARDKMLVGGEWQVQEVSSWRPGWIPEFRLFLICQPHANRDQKLTSQRIGMS